MRRGTGGDPRWITAKFAGECQGRAGECKAPIKRGESAFYYPNGRKLLGRSCGCGETASAEFDAARQDEAFATGQW